MNTLSTRLKVLLLLSGMMLLFYAGCSDKNNDENAPAAQASGEDMDYIAEDYGAALASQDEGMFGMWDASGGGNFTFDDRDRENALDDTLVIHHQGFTLVRVRDFFDLSDVWSNLYLPGITVRMEQTLNVNGTHVSNNGNRSVTISDHENLEVVGLLPTDETKTVNGDGQRHVEGEFHSHFRQNVRTFNTNYLWSITDLQLSSDRLENPYPLDGDIAVHGDWTTTHTNPGRDVEQSVSFSFVVHFDGSRYAQLVFENGATFWIDLENGWCSHDHPGDNG